MKRRMKKFIAVNNYSLFYIIWPINVTFEAESKEKRNWSLVRGHTLITLARF